MNMVSLCNKKSMLGIIFPVTFHECRGLEGEMRSVASAEVAITACRAISQLHGL